MRGCDGVLVLLRVFGMSVGVNPLPNGRMS